MRFGVKTCNVLSVSDSAGATRGFHLRLHSFEDVNSPVIVCLARLSVFIAVHASVPSDCPFARFGLEHSMITFRAL